ncbi:MAG: hypothetical protein AAGG44_06295 [Planctomycetota bacterium]
MNQKRITKRMAEAKHEGDDVLHLEKYVLAGELRNTRRNGVFGWIQFAADFVIRIELTGNFSAELQAVGWDHFRFETAGFDSSPLPEPEDLPNVVQDLADRQIGVISQVSLIATDKQHPSVETTEAETADAETAQTKAEAGGGQEIFAGASLQLIFEWHSQNGHLTANVPCSLVRRVDSETDPEVTPDEQVLDGNPLEPMEGSYSEMVLDVEQGQPLDSEETEDDLSEDEEDTEEEVDPYGLFETDIDQAVSESLSNDRSTAEGARGPRGWEDGAEGLDPETRAMYEQWDEIFEGKKDQPISYLFRKTLRLPRPEAVESEAEAEVHVREILAQLALLSVALDVCEHFTPLATYRLLMNEILPTAKVHPNLAASEMVQHYSTSDHCQACEAEFDADYRPPHETDPEGGPDGESPT